MIDAKQLKEIFKSNNLDLIIGINTYSGELVEFSEQEHGECEVQTDSVRTMVLYDDAKFDIFELKNICTDKQSEMHTSVEHKAVANFVDSIRSKSFFDKIELVYNIFFK